MDFSLVFAQVWGTLGWLIPVALLIGVLKSPWGKGQIGAVSYTHLRAHET